MAGEHAGQHSPGHARDVIREQGQSTLASEAATKILSIDQQPFVI